MIAGVDEAGRGPVIGPLVVAGVMVADDAGLRGIGVRDSKKLAPQRRERLAAQIREMATVEVRMVPAREIDVLRQEMSLNVLEAKLFATIIERLRPDIAYVDSADTSEEAFRKMILGELDISPEIVSRHKADDHYPVVGAASIIAKVTRDAEVHRIREEIGQDIGSGYPSDKVTIAFLERWVAEHGDLPPHTRASWETAKRILAPKAKRLDDFA